MNAMQASASAFCCVRAPARVTGAIAPARVKGVSRTGCPWSIISSAPWVSSASSRRGELTEMVVVTAGKSTRSSRSTPKAIATISSASRIIPRPIPRQKNVLSESVRNACSRSRLRVRMGRSRASTGFTPPMCTTFSICMRRIMLHWSS